MAFAVSSTDRYFIEDYVPPRAVLRDIGFSVELLAIKAMYAFRLSRSNSKLKKLVMKH